MPWGCRQSPFRIRASARVLVSLSSHCPINAKNTHQHMILEKLVPRPEQPPKDSPTFCFLLFHVPPLWLIYQHLYMYIRQLLAEHLATSCQSSCVEKAGAGSFTLIIDIIRSSQTFMGKNKICSQQNRRAAAKTKREALSGQETSALTTEDANSRQQKQNFDLHSFHNITAGRRNLLITDDSY